MILGVLSEAHEKLLALPDEDYFKMILGLAAKNAQAGEGEIFFNTKDLLRLPASFEKQLNETAQKAGGTLHISKEPASIDGGFILRYRPAAPEGEEETPVEEGSAYGTVELNCSLSSLIAEKKDELSDLVYQNLF